jgi:hypothetical protein
MSAEIMPQVVISGPVDENGNVKVVVASSAVTRILIVTALQNWET